MKKKNLQLRDIGEDALVAALTARLAVGEGVVAAAGDDCAILEGTERGRFDLFKTDCIVEGVHFESAAPPSAVGWKAMARTLSDFGAMGGLPRYALVTVALRGDSELTWARALYRGLEKAAARFGVSIVGGETTRIPEGSPALISVALTGEVARARCARRSGGKPGDVLLVTGRLGGALRSGRHLRFDPRLEQGRWLTGAVPVHAMMDLSDGLARDLPRLARASGVGFELDAGAVPRHRGCSLAQALGEGEDYELLLAVAARSAGKLEALWRRRFPRLALTRIGRLVADVGEGSDLEGGWDHFAE